ncbi:MAG: prolyl oligopeptidase family serine peptidase [bacterium]|nr:prolyl oligopeptidase family serine peptidase [bacterium]
MMPVPDSRPHTKTSFTSTIISRLIPLLGTLVILLIAQGGAAREANFELADKWLPDKIIEKLYARGVTPVWIGSSDRFWYKYSSSEGRHYYLVDPAKKTRRPLFDRMQLASALTRLTGEAHDSKHLYLQDIEYLPGDKSLNFSLKEERFNYAIATGVLGRIPEEVGEPDIESWRNDSPDGSLSVFAIGNDLYLLDLSTPGMDPIQLSFDGAPGYGWNQDDAVITADDREKRQVGVAWSPDSRYFVTVRQDQRDVEEMWLVESLSDPRPTLRTFKYPLPGEEVGRNELWLFTTATRELRSMDVARWEDQTLIDLFHETLWWDADSAGLSFVRRSRDYSQLDLCRLDPATTAVEVLEEERQGGQVYIHPLYELPASSEYLWWSMRDGWGHYYLLDDNGAVLNSVTTGEFNVDEIVAVDAKRRVLYFLANGREEGRNPYYRHLYRVGFDGSGLKLLTPADAEHSVSLSPSNKYLVDIHSRVDLPYTSEVRDNRGNLLLELERSDISRLVEAGWQPPEIFKAKAADGVTDHWGVMYKPFDFDPTRKYPIVTHVYPGRQGEYIPRAFSPINTELYLANLGCIVVHFGNRGGTPERGLAYRMYQSDNFRDYGLEDKKVVIEQLAARHDYIDLDSVGIFGSSSGGFMTVSAMLVYPEFFKVGVAMTAPNDPGQYYHIWGERYFGLERVEAEDGSLVWSCEPQGNIELADQLQGRLLMINGELDGNVHPGHMYRMVAAFIEAGKRFDMFIVPGAGHGLGDWRYRCQMIWNYFAEELIEDSHRDADMFTIPDCRQ